MIHGVHDILERDFLLAMIQHVNGSILHTKRIRSDSYMIQGVTKVGGCVRPSKTNIKLCQISLEH